MQPSASPVVNKEVLDVACLNTIYMQAAPEEDLKHVFDVLDKGSNGQITADSLRSAIKVSFLAECDDAASIWHAPHNCWKSSAAFPHDRSSAKMD